MFFKAFHFIKNVCVSESLYGMTNEMDYKKKEGNVENVNQTLDSLVIYFLPNLNHKYLLIGRGILVEKSDNLCTFMLKKIIEILQSNGGFFIKVIN